MQFDRTSPGSGLERRKPILGIGFERIWGSCGGGKWNEDLEGSH